MTAAEAYNKIKYYIVEIQYYIDTMEETLKVIMAMSIIAIIIALAAILFLSYMFFMVKKQQKELQEINEKLKALLPEQRPEPAKQANETPKEEETI
ncbi:MAG: hypothetical protein E7678_06930 [Ruminococcaceae bacterium]|nr:hypothetical protein [Oscillospiraceae bacterium]